MKSRLPVLLLLTLILCRINGYTQIIRTVDGLPLKGSYCIENKNIELVGIPGGGTFSGCGVTLEDGKWIFNPYMASQVTTTFPLQCTIQYTVNGSSVETPVMISKPVIIYPPLEDSFTCTGAIELRAYTLYAGAYEYAWSPAAPLTTPHQQQTTGFINATQAFVVTATDLATGCKGTDTITIVKDSVPDLQLSGDVTILPRTSVRLQASGAATYSWSPDTWLENVNSADPIASPHEDITYTVTGKSRYGCVSSASLTVRLNNQVLIPNAFSPNGDGVNDEFRIVNYGYDQVMEFRVFDRWGKEMFSTTNGTDAWDGTYKGQPAPVGVYYYIIVMSHAGQRSKEWKGDVTLIR